jgi:hypothetical protein
MDEAEAAGVNTSPDDHKDRGIVNVSPPLRAFHGDPAIKAKYLARVREHRELDQIIQGKYWENGRGCAVGCTIHSNDHNRYEWELGIPEPLAHLQDCLFELLPLRVAKHFPVRFLKAIPVGADLSPVCDQFVYWLLTGLDCWMTRHVDDRYRPIIVAVAELYRRRLAGNEPEIVEWHKAECAARAIFEQEGGVLGGYDKYAAVEAAHRVVRYDCGFGMGPHYIASIAEAYSDAVADAASVANVTDIDCGVAMTDKLIELLAAAEVPV